MQKDKEQLFSSLYYSNKVPQWWEDINIFNEYTPLLQENIEKTLNNYAPFSHCYNDIIEYIENCKHFEHPNVIGLNQDDDSGGHWVMVQKDDNIYKIYDSGGMPTNNTYDKNLKYLKKIKMVQEGNIRQSPTANTCGEWAVCYTISESVNGDPNIIPDSLTAHLEKYSPITMQNFLNTYVSENLTNKLYMNDINVFNFFTHNLLRR